MWNTNSFGVRSAAAAAGLLVLLLTSPAVATQSPQIRCRNAIAKGVSTWLSASMKVQLACEADVLRGLRPRLTDCAGGSGTSDVRAALIDLTSQLRSRLQQGCEGVRWSLLSYPGPCPDGDPFDSDDLAFCVEDIAAQVAASLFAVWYPANIPVSPADFSDCLLLVPKRASAMVLKETRLRLRCLFDDERAGDAAVDCRAQLPPYGPGTGDDKLDGKILRAWQSWFGNVPQECAGGEITAFGYGENCPVPVQSDSALVDFQSCVFDLNRRKVPLLLDLAFPSAPVCGNEILQEGEECDDGVANSDVNPDACRLTCTLPVCGDRVTDPGDGETCDDGNTADLDGCDATCGLESCGDGIVNDLPHEQCEDGNSDPHDGCTNDCRFAACGDGVVCSDPSCTTGPGGGPEQCDQGTANSDTGTCKPDCSGFSRVCTLTIGVTNTVKLGALTYSMSYAQASGELAGVGSKVQCTATVSGGLQSFFDNDAGRTLRESLIVDAGFQAPATVARCTFATNDANLSAGAFQFTIDAASDTNFNPVDATMAVTDISCQ